MFRVTNIAPGAQPISPPEMTFGRDRRQARVCRCSRTDCRQKMPSGISVSSGTPPSLAGDGATQAWNSLQVKPVGHSFDDRQLDGGALAGR